MGRSTPKTYENFSGNTDAWEFSYETYNGNGRVTLDLNGGTSGERYLVKLGSQTIFDSGSNWATNGTAQTYDFDRFLIDFTANSPTFFRFVPQSSGNNTSVDLDGADNIRGTTDDGILPVDSTFDNKSKYLNQLGLADDGSPSGMASYGNTWFSNQGQVTTFSAPSNSTTLTFRIESTTLFQLTGSYQSTHPLVSVPENQTFVVDINATDVDGDTLTYSLTDSSDQTIFDLNASTGILSFKAPPNFESNTSSYDVEVRVSDGQANSNILLPVFVTNLNESPTSLSSSASLKILENQPVGTVVGQLTATDPDANTTLTYHLVNGSGDTDNSLFSLETNGTLKSAVSLDYESKGSAHSIRVQVRDQYNALLEGSLPVAVSDVYEPSRTNHSVDLNSSVNLEMIWVEPGTFTMGSPVNEANRSSDETEHNVTLTQGFYLGKYEVTQAQYEAVMTGNSSSLSATPSQWPNNPNRPVEKVSWTDVQVFLTRLNAAEKTGGRLPGGWSYILPTESQWEYACRAGTTTAYSWGNNIDSSRANYNWDGNSTTGSDFKQTRDVGQYGPNPWGFFDMHGNVWEWNSDWYQAAYPTGNPVVDPFGPMSGSSRSRRGGSWEYEGEVLRSANRSTFNPSNKDSKVGFRLAYKDMNTAPSTLTFSTSLTILENQPSGTQLGEYNATDPDTNATLTFSLVNGTGDSSNSLFSLDANGTLKSATIFNFESNASTYSIRVQAKDEFNASVEENFTIQLTNQNENPAGLQANSSLTFSENLPINSAVGSFNATDPDANTNLIYSLTSGAGDGNNSLFSMDSNGILRTATSFDYESNASIYSFRVRVRDDQNASVEGNFTTQLVNQNEAPYDLNNTSPLTVPENQGIGTIISEFNATDPDANSTLIFSLVPGSGDSGNSLFSIDTNGTLRTATLIDYESTSPSQSIRVRVSDENNAYMERTFTVTLTNWFDYPWSKINAPDKNPNDQFGGSISQSGNFLVVGAPGSIVDGIYNAGAAFLYRQETNGSLTLQSKITAFEKGTGDWFGRSVSLSGTSLAIGAQASDPAGTTDAGAVYLYRLESNGSINFTSKITAPDKAANDWFGRSVSQFGNNLVIGAYNSDPDGISNAGAAYVYRVETNGTATFKDKIFAPDKEANDKFGDSISLFENLLVVGAYLSDPNGTAEAGAVYLYQLENNGSSTFLTKITAPDKASSDAFGMTVSVSGNILAVGVPHADPDGIVDAGATYIFRIENNNSATFLSKLTAPDKEIGNQTIFGNQFGYSVSISDNVIAIGANFGRACYLYKILPGGEILYLTKITAPDDLTSGFGTSLSHSKKTLVVGTVGSTNAAYTFDISAFTNVAPESLTSLAPLSIMENRSIGTIVGQLMASDPDANTTLTYSLTPGTGAIDNSLFSMDTNGTLRTAAVFDFESTSPPSFSIRALARDEYNATIEATFNVVLTDDQNEDRDGDGFSDAEETVAGTKLNDPTSKPGLNFGLVAWYPMDGNMSDHSGKNNHGVISGASLSEDRHGQVGKAYSFDGSNDYIRANLSTPLTGQKISISTWVKVQPNASATSFSFPYIIHAAGGYQ